MGIRMLNLTIMKMMMKMRRQKTARILNGERHFTLEALEMIAMATHQGQRQVVKTVKTVNKRHNRTE